MLNNIGTPEIVLIAIVVLVLFGGKKMNELARGIGEAGKELKKAKKEFETSFNEETPDGETRQLAKEKSQDTTAKSRKGVG